MSGCSRFTNKEETMAVPYKPAGHQAVIPYLIIPDAEKALEFLSKVFRAKQAEVFRGPNGRVGHATVTIGDSVLMLGECGPQWPAQPASLYVYLTDVDAAYDRALAAGATSTMKPADQFYGDRNCGVKDSNDVTWWIATHIEDVSEAELQRRSAESMKKRAQAQA
jgi:PhnB protein